MSQPSKEVLGKALLEIRRLKAENQRLQTALPEPIAIVGMACRFPGGATNPEAYWQLLAEGRSGIREVPADRWNGEALTSPDPDQPGKMTTSMGAFLDSVDTFDAGFFGISPKEAQSLDPQQRLTLEMAWEALEDANIPHPAIIDREVGVFVGMSGIDYALKLFDSTNFDHIDPYFGTGASLSPAAGRLSYFLKVTGPSMVIDTACSSSLVAIHLACESLRREECEAAFAGGTNLILNPQLSVNFSKSGLLAQDGQCYTFDARAQGYARGEGAGMLVLKRLSAAAAAGDRIHAVILGSAVNQDGGSGGLTVPRGPSQQQVIRKALQSAGLTPGEIDYVETHGTATPLGDPIEANSLGEVFAKDKAKTAPLLLGSVKTNFGHLEAAAGMASVLKVVQSLRHEVLPPHLNFKEPSPHIDWERYPIDVVTETHPWPQTEQRRIAGINGFGFAGTNAHLILAEAPKSTPEATPREPSAEVLALSAKTPEALQTYAAKVAKSIDEQTSLADLCHTSQQGRTLFQERLALTAADPLSLQKQLRRFVEKGKAKGAATGHASANPSVAFVFTGQGAQYAGMGHELYRNCGTFRTIIDDCADKLQPTLKRDLREILFAKSKAAASDQAGVSVLDATRHDAAAMELDQTRYTQVGLFVIEYALAKLWQQWGAEPSCVLGHSIGEYAAACVAGVFSLEDGLKMVAARGQLMEDHSPAGEMLTVFAEEAEVEAIIAPYEAEVSLAAVNGPGIILVSGAKARMQALRPVFEEAGYRVSPMRITHAFHSPMTEPVLDAFRRVLDEVQFSPPDIPLISNVTGRRESELVAQPDYWVRHLRESVRFCESMTSLHTEQHALLLEIGPEPTLLGLDLCFREIRQQAESSAHWAASLKRGQDDRMSLLTSAARLWAHGVALDWEQVNADRPAHFTDFPTYPFQRKRHWFPFPEASSEPKQMIPLQVEHVESASAAEPQPVEAPPVFEIVAEVICETSGLETADLTRATNLLEMGLDSLMFVRIGRKLESAFQVEIPIKQFYESLHQVGPLVDYLETHGRWQQPATPPPSAASEPQPETPQPQPATPTPAATLPTQPEHATDSLDTVMQAHLSLMQQYLQAKQNGSPSNAPTTSLPASAPDTRLAKVDTVMRANFAGLQAEPEPHLTDSQRAFIADLTVRLNQKTAKSKAQTQAARHDLADWKHSLQFKQSLKELKYPIISDFAEGCRIRDIDGNEYIDLALGMGVHLFGHKPTFIQEALHRQIDATTALGPQSDLSGEVARKIKQLTGAERVSLSVTGSGAVMLATRLARAAKGKPLIAQFGGAYHGIGSEVLMMGEENGQTSPLSPGVPYNLADNVLYLDYGTEEALEAIRNSADQLAAVLVEPVQSRRPGFQPQRFLRQLRQLTEELDLVLIFDEMINGFRIHAGGAQAWFGIEADLITYGKVIGGGMPLSVIAGKAHYLDLIDGGDWQFGDTSHPTSRTIFTGGTHNRHPLALAAANAVLDHMLAEGPQLHAELNEKTAAMIRELNGFFEAEEVSLRATSFGSQFRIESLGSPFEQELFHYSLLDHGIYTWEQRINCLSTQHTAADIQSIVDAAKRSVHALRAGGFALQAKPGAARRCFPMSSVQQRLYALCNREGAEMPYHLSGIWRLEGPVDKARLQDAFHRVIMRHESLRTVFTMVDDQPMQYLVEEPRFALEEVQSNQDPQALLDAFIRPFDLTQPPLIRVGVTPDAEGHAYLLIDAHHLAVDGLSMNTILQECAALYRGEKLSPVKRQYRHAQAALEAQLSSGQWESQSVYWKKTFADIVPVLDLPLDFPRPAIADFAGDRLLLSLPPEQTKRLEQYAAKHGASLFMVLLGAYATLLHHLTQAEDLIVGIPVGGRGEEANEDTVGMFVNSLPLRLQPQGHATFPAFLKQVRERALTAYENQDYPFGELLKELKVPITPDRNPGFDVMFAYESADERRIKLGDVSLETIDQFEGSGMFDFNIDAIRENGVLNLRFHYATSLFKAETIQRWMEYYAAILDGILQDDGAPLRGLRILPKSEESQIRSWERSNEARPEVKISNLVSLWSQRVAQSPDAVALADNENNYTYQEVEHYANGLAEQILSACDIQPDSRIALCLDSTAWMLIGMLGVLKTGAAYVPIDPTTPEERIAFILQDSEAVALVTENHKTIESTELPTFDIRNTVAQSDAPEVEVRPDQLAYVIYTSGSTGQPKGVMVEHQAILHNIIWRHDYYRFTPKDVTLQMPSMAFDASVADIWPVLLAGGKLVCLPSSAKQDLPGIAALVHQHGVTNLLLTPGLYRLMLEEIGPDLRSLRWITLAGEATAFALVEKHFQVLPATQLYNEYGPTENSVISTAKELTKEDTAVTIGRPVGVVETRILNTQGARCPIGVAGEIVLSGPTLARGYLNRPELENRVFGANSENPAERFYRTGDLGCWLDNGEMQFLGRRDHQVKLRGYRIELREISESLLQHPQVQQAVISLWTEEEEPKLVAYVVSEAHEENDLRAFLQQRLPGYMIPTHWVFLSALPLTTNGKIDHKALPAPDTSTGQETLIEPRSQAESDLHEVWTDVLKLREISIHDDYFRLGGDSIKGIQIVSRLKSKGWTLDMRGLFRFPTIAQLAPQMTALHAPSQKVQTEQSVAPLNPTQTWFQRRVTTDAHHFNQSVWIELKASFSPEVVADALSQLAAHHTALRLQFNAEAQTAGPIVPIKLESVDLRNAPDPQQLTDTRIRDLQSSLNPGKGILWQAGLFSTAEGQRLFLTVHHLVIDGFSWRILLEDLEQILTASQSGLPAVLKKSDAWTNACAASSTAPQLPTDTDEITLWQEVLGSELPSLPDDASARAAEVDELCRITHTFASETNAQGLSQAVAQSGLQIDELLLSALRLAWARWNPQQPLLLERESHGREAPGLADFDISRTVGWFTTMHPVRFAACADHDDCTAILRETKEALRALPHNGTRYALLRETRFPESFTAYEDPEVSFNYLGAFTSGAGLLQLSPERPPHARSSQQKPLAALALFGLDLDGQPQWTLEYDGLRFRETTMHRLLKDFEQALREIIMLAQAGRVAPGPSDLVASALSLSAWDQALAANGWQPEEITDAYPLSPMQEGLLYEYLRDPASEAYFEQMTFRLEGTLQREAFNQSWQDLLDRYAVLRAAFLVKEIAEPLQIVLKTMTLPITWIDLTDLSGEQQEARIRDFEGTDRRTPFDLARGPLMRLTVFALDATHVHVTLSSHHILMDGWCVGILYQDWQQLYAARCRGERAQLPPPADYRLFAQWLQSWERASARQFWHQQLTDFGQLTSLPRPKAKRPDDTYTLSEETFTLAPAQWEAMRALAAQWHSTPGNLLQALWAILLARLSNTSDVAFGLIVSGRPPEVTEVENMVGLFINAVPVRLKVSAETSLAACVQQLQDLSEARQAHTALPLAEIQEGLDGLTEAFDHLFVLENYPMEEELREGEARATHDGGDLPRIYEIGGFERTHLDFNLVVVPGKALTVKFTYNAAIFEATDMQRWAKLYESFLYAALENHQVKTHELPRLPEPDQAQLERWNAREAAYPEEATITALFARTAATFPERIALRHEGEDMTYAALNAAANRLAHHLLAQGITVGDRVAVWLPRDMRMVIALLGIQKAGAVFVPLDPSYPDERLAFILEDSEARLILDDADHACPFQREKCVRMADTADASNRDPAIRHTPDDGLYIIYTSGSTGQPKGCLISHRNLVRLMVNEQFDFDFTETDVWVIAHSFCFDFSVWELYGALLYGSKAVITSRETVQDTRKFVELVAAEKVTILNQTPAAFYTFCETYLSAPPAHQLALRMVIFGGDRLEPHYLKPWVERFPLTQVALINMYGITETTVHVTYHRVTEAEILAGDGQSLIGRPLPETTVWVLDQEQQPLPIGVTGELYVGGSGVSLGYLNRPDLNEERFIAHPLASGHKLYRTGDLGRWRADGTLEYLGRNDHQVQIRGFRIEVGEIENALLQHEAIGKAVVVAYEESPGVQNLAAYYTGTQLEETAIRAHVAVHVPDYMVPGYFQHLDALPLSANGKIDRKALPSPHESGQVDKQDKAGPRNAREAIVHQVWTDVLGHTELSIDDNFFSVGGQSLKAVRLATALEAQLNVRIDLADIFAKPTIRTFTESLPTEQATVDTIADEDDELAALVEDLSPEELNALTDSLLEEK